MRNEFVPSKMPEEPGCCTGSGEAHSAGPKNFETKGNTDLPPDRSSGVVGGKAGKYIAGRNMPYTN